MRGTGITRWEARQAVWLLGTLAALLGGAWFVPAFTPPQPREPLATVPGLAWRHDDAAAVSHFLASLRLHGGVLCLGTSETTTLAGGNWPDFLNAVAPRHAVLAGAGRTAGVHLPVLAQHREELRGLQLIYLINPVYWNAEHGPVNPAYWTRYVDPRLLAPRSDVAEGIWQPVNRARQALPLLERLSPASLHRALRAKWFNDIRHRLQPQTFTSAFRPIQRWTGTVPEGPAPRTNLVRGIDSTFHHAEWFRPVASNPEVLEARDEELRAFIRACYQWGVEATFVLGPHNAPFIRWHAPEAEAGYEQIGERLAALLNSEQATWIDARDVSTVPGAFRDHQHHSSYGAALIADKILNQP